MSTSTSITGYGIDVGMRRADDLDKIMLQDATEKIATKGDCSVLDLGCGGGGQSCRLAIAGTHVLGVDISDFALLFESLRKEHELPDASLKFIQADLRDFDSVLTSGKFDICCLQRMIHYLPYTEALSVLKRLRPYVPGKLYISATGLSSAIGDTYEDTSKLITERFCPLTKEAAETFSIHEPLCLYKQAEFETLLRESGWCIEKCWMSTFGNVKAVCTNKV